MQWSHLLSLCANLNRVGDQLGGFLLLDAYHLLELDGDLSWKVTQRSVARRGRAKSNQKSPAWSIYRGLPSKDIAVEADPILR